MKPESGEIEILRTFKEPPRESIGEIAALKLTVARAIASRDRLAKAVLEVAKIIDRLVSIPGVHLQEKEIADRLRREVEKETKQ